MLAHKVFLMDVYWDGNKSISTLGTTWFNLGTNQLNLGTNNWVQNNRGIEKSAGVNWPWVQNHWIPADMTPTLQSTAKPVFTTRHRSKFLNTFSEFCWDKDLICVFFISNYKCISLQWIIIDVWINMTQFVVVVWADQFRVRKQIESCKFCAFDTMYFNNYFLIYIALVKVMRSSHPFLSQIRS